MRKCAVPAAAQAMTHRNVVNAHCSPRERWAITCARSGGAADTRTRAANRERELNVWRYLPNRAGSVSVTARSASGEWCSVP